MMAASYQLAPTVPDAAASASLVYVHPGRTCAVHDGESLTTVVGSGAAVCVWDPIRGIGGMSHFLLPDAGNAPPATRFGDVAMRTLLEQLAARGADCGRLRARIFGGSAPPIADGAHHLGDRNVEAAVTFLQTKSVLVVQRDSGGTGARKVVFSPRNGFAEVSHVGQN